MSTLSSWPHDGHASTRGRIAEPAIPLREDVSDDAAIPSLFDQRGPFDPVPAKVEIPIGVTIAEMESALIQLVLDRTADTNPRMRTAAQLLGVSEKTLSNKIKQYGLRK